MITESCKTAQNLVKEYGVRDQELFYVFQSRHSWLRYEKNKGTKKYSYWNSSCFAHISQTNASNKKRIWNEQFLNADSILFQKSWAVMHDSATVDGKITKNRFDPTKKKKLIWGLPIHERTKPPHDKVVQQALQASRYKSLFPVANLS